MQGRSRRLNSRWLGGSNNGAFFALRNRRTGKRLQWRVPHRGVELPVETLEEISNAETSVALYYDFNCYNKDCTSVADCYVESSPEESRESIFISIPSVRRSEPKGSKRKTDSLLSKGEPDSLLSKGEHDSLLSIELDSLFSKGEHDSLLSKGEHDSTLDDQLYYSMWNEGHFALDRFESEIKYDAASVEDFGYMANEGESEFMDMGGESEFMDMGGESEFTDIGGESKILNIEGESEFMDIEGESEFMDIEGESEFMDIGGESEFMDIGGEPEFLDIEGESEFIDIGGESEFLDIGGESEFMDIARESEFIDIEGESEFMDIGGESEFIDIEGESEFIDIGEESESTEISNSTLCDDDSGSIDTLQYLLHEWRMENRRLICSYLEFVDLKSIFNAHEKRYGGDNNIREVSWVSLMPPDMEIKPEITQTRSQISALLFELVNTYINKIKRLKNHKEMVKQLLKIPIKYYKNLLNNALNYMLVWTKSRVYVHIIRKFKKLFMGLGQ
ncbi:hypothetical protein ACOME3_009320 [Neoechinorhynchus agilis]